MTHWGGPWVLGNATESANWNGMVSFMREMMGPSGSGFWFWQLHWILELITWILIIAVLVALFRWLWKKGEK